MVTMDILNGLSLSAGRKLLSEEGYTEDECIEKDDITYDRLFLYPYLPKDENGNIIDTVYRAEYCNQVVDDEYSDGRMMWEDVKSGWTK